MTPPPGDSESGDEGWDAWGALDRVFAGESTPEESAAVHRWLLAHPDLRRDLDAARAGLNPARAIPPDDATDAAWLSVARRARDLELRRPSPTESARDRTPAVRPASGWANGRTGAGLWGWRWLVPFSAGLAVAAAVLITTRLGRHTPAEHEYVTTAGQREKVTLSDGTRFTLAPASRLRVPGDYSAGNRSVVLDGEAYFAVVHDPAHPFAVRAGDAVATDVGTEFDMRAYAGDPAVRVAIAQGRVAVEPVEEKSREPRGAAGDPTAARSTTLDPGDIALMSDTSLAITHSADVGAISGWTDGTLRFVDTPVPEAIAELDRWYDIDIRVTDPAIASRHVTGAFREETVQQVLDIVATSLSTRVVQAGRVVTLTPIR